MVVVDVNANYHTCTENHAQYAAVMVQDTTMSEFGSSSEGASSKKKTVIIVSVVVAITVVIALTLVIVTVVCVIRRKKHRRLTFISVNSDAEVFYTPLISSNEDIELVNKLFLCLISLLYSFLPHNND